MSNSSLPIEKKNVISAFKQADPKGKLLLENLFGKELFSSKITDRIKTWEDAAAERNLDPIESLPFKHAFKNSFEIAANAFFMLDVIASVLNENIILDWTNSDQKKWYCWFNNYKEGSGFSFDASSYVWTNANTLGGARLCVHSKELAEYFGTQFLPIFNQFLNPIK
jgi:hypothetical protein